jgi:putative flippase GtrA
MKKIKRPNRKSVRQFVLFNVGGMAFFIVGYAIFSLCYGVLSWRWWVSKVLGDLAGWLVNYLIQRFLAFREESKGEKEHVILAKFTALSLVNVVIDYCIVGGLNQMGVSPFIGLFVSSWFFTVWKFIWYRWWVFHSSRTSS